MRLDSLRPARAAARPSARLVHSARRALKRHATPALGTARRPAPADIPEERLRAIADEAPSRLDLWERIVEAAGARVVAEIGVYRGRFAASLLAACPRIERYYMIDPWRHLDDWNKPANKDDDVFARFRREALDKTKQWADKRVVLRGTTAEVIADVPDGTLDFAYIDGDHTLRGITIDLTKVFPKVRDGGWIGGDDFAPSIWQHDTSYEPTLVFPYAVHFAEAVGVRIYALPHRQFLMQKRPDLGFAFVDLTGRYGSADIKTQLAAAAAPAPAPAPDAT
jgi:predicted O-methyltransferase YrrM